MLSRRSWLKGGQWLMLAVMVLVGVLALNGRALADWLEQGDGLPVGAFVARVYYEEMADIEGLAAYDLWEFNNLKERYVLVSMDAEIYRQLERAGWKVVIDDEATATLSPASGVETFFGGYRTVDEIHTDLDAIVAAHPDIAEVVDYGDSYCKVQGGCVTGGGEPQPGYDLKAIRITNQAIPGPKPVFFLMANIHAREITTPELAMRMVDWLVDGYNASPDPTWIVDHHEVWIVPVANPDGHWLVELGTLPPYNGSPFSQRKNANRSNGCNTWPPNSFTQYGIDLNRNHSFEWNTGGSSNAPCDQTYRGPEAASETEVWQLEELARSLIPDQRGPNPEDPAPLNTTGIFITLHSYSELVLWPWGNVTTPAPNKPGLKAIGDKFATYNGYESCQPSICLYITSGTSDDFAYGELGVPAYTFEVGTQFMPPYSEVDAEQWPLNGPAMQYAAKIARTPYMLVQGPDALNASVTDNGNDIYTLTATIDDSDNGNRPIRRAVYFLDTPYWNGGSPTPMQAADGSFNSPVEDVTATIDASGLEPGRHLLFVHGQDNQNKIGPASAAFLIIVDPETSPVIEGFVTEADTGAPLAATVSAGALFQTTTNPATGFYSMQVISGTYDLTATAADHATVTVEDVVAHDFQTVEQDFALARICEAFSDDVEAGNIGWTAESPWAIVTEAAHSPTHSWTDSPGGNYGNNRDRSITSPIIDLSEFTNVSLEFWHVCDTESGYDYCHVEVSDNGGASWTEVAIYDGSQSQWEEVSVAAPTLDGAADGRIRFRLTTDGSVTEDGWHVDDIRLIGAGPSCTAAR